MDYTNFISKKTFSPSDKNNSRVKDTQKGLWWLEENEKDMAKTLLDTGNDLEQNNAARQHLMNLIHARLYGNFDILSFGARDYNQAGGIGNYGSVIGNKLSLNVVASCIDTLGAKICKNKPRAMFVTSGGSWVMQQKGKNLNKFGNALFHETKIHQEGRQVCFDSYIFGTGALHAFIGDDDKLHYERTFIDDLFVDDADGLNGKPRQLLRKKLVSRAQLLNDFPNMEETILEASSKSENKPLYGNSDMVDVWEGWHLPTGKKSGDGQHVIAVSSGLLFAEEWKLHTFPFIFKRYRQRVRGFWGQGVAEILTGIQVALNRTLRSIDEQIRRKGKGRVYYAFNSIDPAHLDNSVQAHVPFKGSQPPIQDSSSAVSQDELAHAQNLYQKAFQEVGISELSAAAKKPSGLDAAVALREFNDIETERFILEGQAYENMYMEAMELGLELIRQTGGKGYKVRLPNKRFLVEIDWKDIDLERDEYVLQMFPVSSLPSTPAARLQKVEELRGGGYIDMPTAKRLLDFPDIDAEMNLANSAADDVDACLSMILDDATPTMPTIEVYQSLDLIIERGTTQYLYAKHHDCEEKRLQMLRDYIDNATKAKTDMLTPPPPPAPAPGMMPSAPPGMAPPGATGPMSNTVNVNAPIQPTVPPVVGGQ